ncbi:hypothetical protein KY389_14365 [Paracoccus bogoriensis]|uniref:hypothetical protein n=1 Tax=Paracoccus bogoriensis TaxID=242065 RepID=UPI001CA5C7CB|nr:hypothetical protein [Paracoccus bogoriensis]MBW7057845.1 hypothetical protein [Paracoccus bogoriensis]
MSAPAEPSSEPPVRRHTAVTPARRKTFLRALAETGSYAAAAKAATPYSSNRSAAVSTFRRLRAIDPEFAAACDEAIQTALGKVESTIWDRAINGTQRPVVSGGQIVGYETVVDNKLLLSLARRLDPEAWSETRKVEHSGQIDSRSVSFQVTLAPEDIYLLKEEKRALLLGLLEDIAQAKEKADE